MARCEEVSRSRHRFGANPVQARWRPMGRTEHDGVTVVSVYSVWCDNHGTLVPSRPMTPRVRPKCASARPRVRSREAVWGLATRSAAFVQRLRRPAYVASVPRAIGTMPLGDSWGPKNSFRRSLTKQAFGGARR
jgi:hypothetical protein